MSKTSQPKSDNQAAQSELVDRAGRLPGVVEAIDVYERLVPYPQQHAHVRPSQLQNATGGDVG